MSDNQPNHKSLDPSKFWKALGVRAVGAAVVTARGAEGPRGFLALSVTHLSQNPPILLVGISKTTGALGTVLESRHFAVNYLAETDEAMASDFGGRSERKGADRFDEARWTTLVSGAPALKGAVGVIDCLLDETIERHGTVLALGRIVAYSADETLSPLIYFRGHVTTTIPTE